MSTSMTVVQQQCSISEKELQRRRRFIRSSSIEKIIQFNSYICSQNYFLLPSLVAWLKSSQSTLHTQAEALKTLFIFQFKLVFTFFWRCHWDAINSDLFFCLEMMSAVVQHAASLLLWKAKRVLFVFLIYLTFLAIFAQLAACIFLLSEVILPAGLIFLFVCMYLISHLNMRVLFHHLSKVEHVSRCQRTPRRCLLGKKTISNLNLF